MFAQTLNQNSISFDFFSVYVFDMFFFLQSLRLTCSFFLSSPVNKELKWSYCDRSMSVIRHQEVALKDYCYIPEPTDSKLGRKY